MAATYRIIDEPRPTPLQRFALNPFWPFLAIMFGGLWLSWPLFALNSLAIGSATRRREITLIIGGLLAVTAATFGVYELAARGVVGADDAPYCMLGVTVIKLVVTYRLHFLQARSFELFEYFGGVARNGAIVLLIAFLLRVQVARALDGPWWWVLS